MSKETWLPYPFAPDMYAVSDRGRVRSLTRKKDGVPIIRSAHKDKDGYLHISLFSRGDERRGKYAVSRMVLETFVGKPPKGWQADHINSVRDDNRLKNLRWVTRKSNTDRRNVATGTRNGNHMTNRKKRGVA